MIRSKKILDAARGELCTINTPACNHNPETTVAAHSNWLEHGKSLGIKAHDVFVAFACSECHAYVDQYIEGQQASKEYWTRGHALTLVRLIEKGVITVDGYEPQNPVL